MIIVLFLIYDLVGGVQSLLQDFGLLAPLVLRLSEAIVSSLHFHDPGVLDITFDWLHVEGVAQNLALDLLLFLTQLWIILFRGCRYKSVKLYQIFNSVK